MWCDLLTVNVVIDFLLLCGLVFRGLRCVIYVFGMVSRYFGVVVFYLLWVVVVGDFILLVGLVC